MAKKDSSEKAIVRREAVKFLHVEIFNRYRREHLAQIPEIKSKNLLIGIEQHDIDRLQDLFTSTIYPQVEDRTERDKSFESLIRMLKNPRRLIFIIPSIPSITLRHAAVFPAAMRIGLNTVLAYTLSNRLEDKMVDNLFQLYLGRGEIITGKLKVNFNDYHAAYAAVPQADGRKMIGLSSTVMKAGKNKRLVNATWEIMTDVRQALVNKDENLKKAGRPPEHPDDIAAIGFGISVLDKVKETFDYFPESVMDRMIQVSLLTELEYLNRMYGV